MGQKMTSDLDLLQKEQDFEEARDREIAAIAKKRKVSLLDAAQIWQDEYDEAVNNGD
ncbi:hypothetical protein ACI8B_210127 [Acinetobacter proteolyticus]|uniref:Uncharacterized protein n=2 Tax=Acinetobacter proteolyticus TaxID=1776741 RepID=A0A653K3D1_9GAMM|nr:hypothetical protein ACI8B_210127 [Acinetobacter proteolyticus]